MFKDKDIVASFEPLAAVVDQWYLGALTGNRAASVTELAKCLQQVGARDFIVLPTVAASLRQAIAECQEKDRIAVFGSFHTVAAGLNLVKNIGNSEES